MAMKNETNQNNVITEFKKTKTKNEKTKQNKKQPSHLKIKLDP